MFLRRTEEEKRHFGGEVFIDIDGVNSGTLDDQNREIRLDAGTHKIKMYKSHNFGTFIGIAEIELDTSVDDYVLQYSCPLHVQSPGNIKATLLTPEVNIDALIASVEGEIARDRRSNELRIEEQEKRKAKENGYWLIFGVVFVLLMILQSIIYADALNY